MPELKPCPACGSDNVECLVCTINADEKQDIHFHIACESCYTSGPIADNGKIAVDKWNSLPRRPDYNDVDCAGCPERRRGYLTWTTEPPKVAGWYFSREKWASGKWRNYGPMKVYADNETGVLQVKGWGKTLGGVAKYGDSGDSVEWAGPIPMPLEPEES